MLTMKLYEQLPEEAVRIRTEVFMDEQGFCNEFDEIDKTALHAVLYEDGKAAATGRIYYEEEIHNCYVIGRLAVDKACRGKQYGARLLRFMEEEAEKRGGSRIGLSAQKQAMGFYQKQGYYPVGDYYMDEQCPHIWMQKEVNYVK